MRLEAKEPMPVRHFVQNCFRRGNIALAVTRWDISLTLNMTHLVWGIAAVATLLRNDSGNKDCRATLAMTNKYTSF